MSITGRLTQGFAWLWPLLALTFALPLVAVSLVTDRPLVGSTAVLALAFGLLLVPLLPRDSWSPAIVLAALPGALARRARRRRAQSLSTVGHHADDVRARPGRSSAAAAIELALASVRSGDGERGAVRRTRLWRWRDEIAVVAGLAGIAALSAALSHLVIRGGFPPLGTDWGHYFLYAGEVREHGRLYLENPYWMGGGRPFANDAGAGALLGSLGRFDGLTDATLVLGHRRALRAHAVVDVRGRGRVVGTGGRAGRGANGGGRAADSGTSCPGTVSR